jgi:hypothetical protein
MTEVQLADSSATQNHVATQDQGTSDVSNQAQTTQSEPRVQDEKMIPQSQVNKIAAREAREAEERTRQRMLAEFEQRQQQVSQQTSQAQPQAATSLGGIPQMTPEQIEQIIERKAYEMTQRNVANKIAADFESKVKQAKLSDPEFADKYDALNIEQHPRLILWMSSMDNMTDMIKDMADNPSKVANIMMLANGGFPQLAQKELARLSDSIKKNQEAQQQPQANEPLRQIKPSTIGTDNGSMTVSDFRKMFKG